MKKRAVGAALAVLASMGVMTQAAATTVQARTTRIQQGISSRVAQSANIVGRVRSNQPMDISIIMKTQNTQQLQSYIQSSALQQGVNRSFLSTSQFAQEFGGNAQVIQMIKYYFQRFGIRVHVMPDMLDIQLHGTAAQFNAAFRIHLFNLSFQGQNFIGTKDTPVMPSTIGDAVLAVLGLNTYSPYSSALQHIPKAAQAVNKATSVDSPPTGVFTPSGLTAHYNIDPMYNHGNYGQGQTLGIVTLASFKPSDATTYWNAYGIHRTGNLSIINVDGGAGAISYAAGSSESDVDVEQSGMIAPAANIDVYVAPNTDPGFADAFFQAVSDNQVGSLSVSWGQSETLINYLIATGQEDPAYAQVFNEVYQEAAAQGISTFASAGDSGAFDASGDLGTTNLSVDSPADSPYVTAAGGTTLPWSLVPGNTTSLVNAGDLLTAIPTSVVTSERAWGWDYLWPHYSDFLQSPHGTPYSSEQSFAESLISGGGGGYSVIFTQPPYQQGVSGISHYSYVNWLTPTNHSTSWNFNPAPTVQTGTSNGGRAVPDVSLNADPFTGYDVYGSVFGAGANGWSSGWGGTSFVAPQLNGIAALVDSYVGSRVGEWNPQIYTFAKGPQSPFNPLNASGTSNDNLYFTGTNGTIWNPGSGLGVPNVEMLANDFKNGVSLP